MHHWPVDIALSADADLSLGLQGQPLYIRRLKPTTLSLSREEPSSRRLVAVSESADTLRFVPCLGQRPLLIFPRPRLLCPASLRLSVVLEFPLQVTIYAGRGERLDLIETLVPASISRGLYGPVDAGIVCASIKARCAPTIEDLEQEQDGQGRWPSNSLIDDQSRRHSLLAYGRLEITNGTDGPLEVSKIMIPTQQLFLYQSELRLLTNTIKMKLVSKQEAELVMGGAPEPQVVPIGTGHPPANHDRKALIFSHAYRLKTGLEYGF
jgi:hypothetical protein